MRSNFTLQNWLKYLHYIIPPEGIVYVGAGTGASIVNYTNDSVKTTVLIEADESYYAKLSQLANQHKGWSVYTAVVTDKVEEAIYYQASNLNESSSLNPEGLSKIWRNLRTIEERSIITTSLADLLVATGYKPNNLNWLVIDCLPALPILQGAGQYMTSWDVISARVLLDETICPGQGASKSEIDAYLTVLGYRCLVIEEERQPALANVLYIKDWKLCQNKALANKKITKQLSQACDEQNKLIDDLQSQNQQLTVAKNEQVKQLTQARDQQVKLVGELQAQIQQLSVARDEQTKESTQQVEQVKQLTLARDQQVKLVGELQAQIQQLSVARDEQTKQSTQQVEQVKQLTLARDQQVKLVGELQAQIQQLTAARDEQTKQSTQQVEQVKQLTLARDQQTKLAEERLKQFDDSQKHVQQLEAQNTELATRQTLLQNEIVRAEAQIDLIKDVLLREPGL